MGPDCLVQTVEMGEVCLQCRLEMLARFFNIALARVFASSAGYYFPCWFGAGGPLRFTTKNTGQPP